MGWLNAPGGRGVDTWDCWTQRKAEGQGGSVVLTTAQESCSPVLDLRAQLPCLLQVLQHVDNGGKQHHVLLPTAKGHLEELVQVLRGGTHDVTWGAGDERGD